MHFRKQDSLGGWRPKAPVRCSSQALGPLVAFGGDPSSIGALSKTVSVSQGCETVSERDGVAALE